MRQRRPSDFGELDLYREPYKYDEQLVDTFHAPSPIRHAGRHLVAIAVLNFLLTMCIVSSGFYLPQRMALFGLDGGWADWVVVLFAVGTLAGGLTIPYTLPLMRSHTVPLSLLLMLIGYTVLCNARGWIVFLLAGGLVGTGYGILLPLLFDKAAYLSRGHHRTWHLVIIFAATYVGIAITPLFDRLLSNYFHLPSPAMAGYTIFPFMSAAIIVAIVTILCTLRPHEFMFKTEGKYYPKTPAGSK